MNDQNLPPAPPPYPSQPPQAPPYHQSYAPAQPTYAQPPYQQPSQGQPAYGYTSYPAQPFMQSGPPSSGYRVASGIVGIVLGVWLFFSFLVGVSLQQQAVLLLTLLACLGSIAAGIVVLVKHRRRGRAEPIVLICVAGVALLFSFGTFGQFLFTFLLSTPIFIVMGIGLAREAKGY